MVNSVLVLIRLLVMQFDGKSWVTPDFAEVSRTPKADHFWEPIAPNISSRKNMELQKLPDRCSNVYQVLWLPPTNDADTLPHFRIFLF